MTPWLPKLAHDKGDSPVGWSRGFAPWRFGIEVIDVETQVTIASGLPAFNVVGLPDKAVAESRERVRAALAALGLALTATAQTKYPAVLEGHLSKTITKKLATMDDIVDGTRFLLENPSVEAIDLVIDNGRMMF